MVPKPGKITEMNSMIACFQSLYQQIKGKISITKAAMERWTDKHDQKPAVPIKSLMAHAFANHMVNNSRQKEPICTGIAQETFMRPKEMLPLNWSAVIRMTKTIGF